MSFIRFESATEKERIRNELRNAREEMLEKAKRNAEARAEYEANKKLKGENTWMHPSISDKLKKMMKEHKGSKNKKKDKDKKKSKKSKKDSKKKKRKYSSPSSSSESSSTEEEIKKRKKRKKRKSSSSSSSSDSETEEEEEDEWVEKKMDTTTTKTITETEENLIRDNWMTEGQLFLKTYSKENNSSERREKNKPETYDPAKSSRELNPHWKDGGKGIPTFQRPRDDDDYRNRNYSSYNRKSLSSSSSSGNWKKDSRNNDRKVEDQRESENRRKNEKHERNRNESKEKHRNSDSNDNNLRNDEKNREEDPGNFLNDQQMNELGAKLVKAEIMGNEELVKELKEKLEKAREIRKDIKEQAKNRQSSSSSSSKHKNNDRSEKEEHILLTTTNSKGMTKPLSTKHPLSYDPYGGRKANKRKEKVETHIDGERVRYFPDDDRYDIKQMFEREKYVTGHDSDAQFIEIAGKHKNPKDDLEDIFADKVRQSMSDYDREEKEKKRAIIEHERYTRMLESCENCFDSPKMEKGLMVAMGSTSYLSIPYHVGLQAHHCCIIPMQHITCSTQLDEDTWNEITEFRKGITRMFASISKEVIFFEIANYLHKKPHMVIHCVASENFEMAPMYFKKAIQESEYEWSTNKQLITLKEKDLRRSIPKGLPYFWVNFGMDLGFAHVIEDQHKFKPNFAQEIIGGILQLNHKAWRKPRKEQNFVEKVKQLADLWKPFDFTTP